MPYVVSSPQACEEFPPTCPYCGERPADATVELRYSKMDVGVLGNARSKNWKTPLPACESCARWFRRTRPLLFALGGGIVLLPIAMLFLPEWFGWVWGATGIGWLVLLLWRNYRSGAFRIDYIGPGEIVYAMRSRDHAQRFAALNQLRFEHRMFVVRWS